MFTTIVWATDGTPSADHALPYAKALAAVENGKLVAVHADEHFIGPACAYPVLADEDEITTKIREQIAEVREEGFEASVSIVPAAASGAAHTIADVARKVGADAIVAGTHGHGVVVGLLVGSVTERLLHIAPCPVLVVPSGRPGAAENGHRMLEVVQSR
jgi:nucleotide-binding universal stress UspA family protein